MTQALGPQAPAKLSAEHVFTQIYRQALWGRNAEGVGFSGAGSLLHRTVIYRAFLQLFLRANDIRSVVDAGCGDWTFSCAIDWSGIDYRGYDVVETVINENNRKYGKPNIRFIQGNVVDHDLPPADLLLCKHVLQHLPEQDVMRFLHQLPKYRHALVTNSVNPRTLSAENRNIVMGDYREFDPTAYPYNVRGIKVLTYWEGAWMNQVVHIQGRA